MGKTPDEIAESAREIRRAFSEKFAAIDARCRQIVGNTVHAAEERAIRRIRAKYE